MAPPRKRVPPSEALVVKYGDRGPIVRALQALLNAHAHPAPNLKIDGYFGPKTLAALTNYQAAERLRVDGIASRATWYRLTYSTKPARITPPDLPVDVSAWPMPKRIAEVIRLLPGKLPHELWSQLAGLMSTDVMVIAVGLYAASHAFGVGELIDIGILLIVGEQGVIELADCIQITVLAMSPKDLDEAATHLARAISIITVYKFASFLTSVLRNRGPAGGEPGSSTSQTPAPVTGETTATPVPKSGETSSTGPPVRGNIGEDSAPATPKTDASPGGSPSASTPSESEPTAVRNPAKLAEGFAERARPAEVRTAERLTQNPEFDGRTFDAPPPPDPGYDWTDELGRTYDAMGDGTKSQYFKLDQFTDAIDNHLLKGNDFTVIDMTGYTPEQTAAVEQYIDSLPAAQQAIIRKVGF